MLSSHRFQLILLLLITPLLSIVQSVTAHGAGLEKRTQEIGGHPLRELGSWAEALHKYTLSLVTRTTTALLEKKESSELSGSNAISLSTGQNN